MIQMHTDSVDYLTNIVRLLSMKWLGEDRQLRDTPNPYHTVKPVQLLDVGQ